MNCLLKKILALDSFVSEIVKTFKLLRVPLPSTNLNSLAFIDIQILQVVCVEYSF